MIEKENIPQLVDDLFARRLRQPTPELDLETFKEFYHEVSKRQDNVQQYIYVIILGREAYCQFSEIFNQHYLLLHAYSDEVVREFRSCRPPIGAKRR